MRERQPNWHKVQETSGD